MCAQLAILIPIYNESAVLPHLFEELKKTLDAEYWEDGDSVSITFIDDGSDDGSLDLLRDFSKHTKRVSIIQLSRNFGHQAAITAGIMETRADSYVLMDGDLQDPPALIVEMVALWKKGADVVLAERRSRQDGFVRGLLFKFYHNYINCLLSMRIPENVGLYCLMNEHAMSALRKMHERNRYFPGLREWVGFKKERIFYDRDSRYAGSPKQNYFRLFSLALDSIFSFSYLPLRLVTVLGSFISILGFMLGLYFVIKRLIGVEVADTGFTTIIVLITLLGGFQLISVGILGEYLARIYDEAKERPHYIVKSYIRPESK